MSKTEKIQAAAQKVREVEEIEKAISEIRKRKRVNEISMPTTDTMSNRDDKVTIPISMRLIVTQRIVDALEQVKAQLLEEIEETTI